jgi:hypothetical protein
MKATVGARFLSLVGIASILLYGCNSNPSLEQTFKNKNPKNHQDTANLVEEVAAFVAQKRPDLSKKTDTAKDVEKQYLIKTLNKNFPEPGAWMRAVIITNKLSTDYTTIFFNCTVGGHLKSVSIGPVQKEEQEGGIIGPVPKEEEPEREIRVKPGKTKPNYINYGCNEKITDIPSSVLKLRLDGRSF